MKFNFAFNFKSPSGEEMTDLRFIALDGRPHQKVNVAFVLSQLLAGLKSSNFLKMYELSTLISKGECELSDADVKELKEVIRGADLMNLLKAQITNYLESVELSQLKAETTKKSKS